MCTLQHKTVDRRAQDRSRSIAALKHNDYDGLFTELHWQVAHDGRGSIISIVDPHGHGRSYSYDSLARRTHIDDPNAGTLDYTYDDTGRLLTRTDAIGQVVENTYGLAGRLHETHLRPSAAEPALSSYIYHYDEASPEFPTAQNLRGQLAWIEGPVSSTYSSYDEQGRIVSVLRQVWDPMSSDFEAQARDSFQADFLLDPQGKLLGATLPGGLDLAYGYNDRELLESLTASFSGTTAASLAGVLYDAQGKVMQSDRGNGTRRCAGYDRRQRLTSLTAGPSSDTLCDNGTGAFLALRYDYGPAGLISTVTDTSVDVAGIPRLDAAYEYDRLYELVQSATEHGTTNYSYDAIQNITRVDTDVPYPPFATGDFAYGENGAGPNALTRAGDVTLSYDAAGYARTYRGHELVFDPAGRMIVARDGRGTVIRNYYDAGGERVLKISEQPGEPAAVYRYIFDGYQERRGEPTWILSAGGGPVAEITETAGLVPDLFLLEELSGYLLDPVSQPRPAPQELLDLDGDGDGAFDADDLDVAARRYLGTTAAAAPVRVVRYYYGDHLGGTTHVADALGEVVSHSQYQAYGSLLSQRGVQPIYGFTGAEREPETDLGLMRMGARWYAPAVGRWVSPDPLFSRSPAKAVESPLEANVYSYVLNNPAAFIDPNGTCAVNADGTVDCEAPGQALMSSGSAQASEGWENGSVGDMAEGAGKVVYGLVSATCGKALNWTLGFALNSGVKYGTGVDRLVQTGGQDSGPLLEGSVGLLAIAGPAKILKSASAKPATQVKPVQPPASGPTPLVNQLPAQLEAEMAAAAQAGATPIRASATALEGVVNQGTVKWVVTEGGELIVSPHTVGGVEISHAVLSGGRPVLAAGHAEVAGAGGEFFGMSINARSGHFGEGLVEIGKAAFAELGITFQ